MGEQELSIIRQKTMNLLTRDKSNMKKITIDYDRKIDEIDFLKGYSIFTIVVMHLIQGYLIDIPQFIKTISAFGGTGVHVFFLCSGIGLYFSYFRNNQSFSKFIKKRFFKIYIPYIIVVVISFFIPWMYSEPDRVTALLSHIFLFKMFFPQYEQSFGGQLWFVSTIFQLYLLFIPICKIKKLINNNYIFFTISMLLSIAWWVTVYCLNLGSVRIWNSFCLQYIWEFSLGFIVADYFIKNKHFEIKLWNLIIIAVAGLAFQFVMAKLAESLKIFNDVPGLIGFTALAILIYQIRPIKCFINKISIVSYEWFLVHILVFDTIIYFVKPLTFLHSIIFGLISLILSYVLAVLYKLLLDKIVFKRKDKINNKKMESQ